MGDIRQDENAKVLYAALQRMSDDRAVIKQAFQYWLVEMSDDSFDVVDTVSGLEKYLGLAAQERKVLMVSMHAAANRAGHELPEVPDYVLGARQPLKVVQNNNTAADSTKAPVMLLTESYFKFMFEGIRKVDRKSYREIQSVLEGEGLSGYNGSLNAAVKQSFENGLRLPDKIPEAMCQEICHSLYMLTAEIIGPNDADMVSNNAISALLEMEAATRFDPRDLI